MTQSISSHNVGGIDGHGPKKGILKLLSNKRSHSLVVSSLSVREDEGGKSGETMTFIGRI